MNIKKIKYILNSLFGKTEYLSFDKYKIIINDYDNHLFKQKCLKTFLSGGKK